MNKDFHGGGKPSRFQSSREGDYAGAGERSHNLDKPFWIESLGLKRGETARGIYHRCR